VVALELISIDRVEGCYPRERILPTARGALVSEAADMASRAVATSGRLQRSSSSIQGAARIDTAAAALYSLEVIKLPEAKRGFVLLSRRWVVERSFAWTVRFRRLARDYE
jgi:hypothetical protein